MFYHWATSAAPGSLIQSHCVAQEGLKLISFCPRLLHAKITGTHYHHATCLSFSFLDRIMSLYGMLFKQFFFVSLSLPVPFLLGASHSQSPPPALGPPLPRVLLLHWGLPFPESSFYFDVTHILPLPRFPLVVPGLISRFPSTLSPAYLHTNKHQQLGSTYKREHVTLSF